MKPAGMGFGCIGGCCAHGVANVVVDSSSIEVNRKARRAKTDRLDVRKLLALLLRWTAGERKAWSVVHVPSPAAENDRQLTRELEAVRDDRTRVRNRIQGLLATQGVRLSIDRHFDDGAGDGADRRWPPVPAGAARAAGAGVGASADHRGAPGDVGDAARRADHPRHRSRRAGRAALAHDARRGRGECGDV